MQAQTSHTMTHFVKEGESIVWRPEEDWLNQLAVQLENYLTSATKSSSNHKQFASQTKAIIAEINDNNKNQIITERLLPRLQKCEGITHSNTSFLYQLCQVAYQQYYLRKTVDTLLERDRQRRLEESQKAATALAVKDDKIAELLTTIKSLRQDLSKEQQGNRIMVDSSERVRQTNKQQEAELTAARVRIQQLETDTKTKDQKLEKAEANRKETVAALLADNRKLTAELEKLRAEASNPKAIDQPETPFGPSGSELTPLRSKAGGVIQIDAAAAIAKGLVKEDEIHTKTPTPSSPAASPSVVPANTADKPPSPIKVAAESTDVDQLKADIKRLAQRLQDSQEAHKTLREQMQTAIKDATKATEMLLTQTQVECSSLKKKLQAAADEKSEANCEKSKYERLYLIYKESMDDIFGNSFAGLKPSQVIEQDNSVPKVTAWQQRLIEKVINAKPSELEKVEGEVEAEVKKIQNGEPPQLRDKINDHWRAGVNMLKGTANGNGALFSIAGITASFSAIRAKPPAIEAPKDNPPTPDKDAGSKADGPGNG